VGVVDANEMQALDEWAEMTLEVYDIEGRIEEL
jgi:hypothetical protein